MLPTYQFLEEEMSALSLNHNSGDSHEKYLKDIQLTGLQDIFNYQRHVSSLSDVTLSFCFDQKAVSTT